MVAVSAHRRSSGFTLVELLVVIVIISILAGMLTPAIIHAIFRAKVLNCTNNQRQLYQLGTVYASAHRGSWPPAHGEDLWLFLRRTVPPLIEKEHAAILSCPVREEEGGPEETHYRGPAVPFGRLKITDPLCADKEGNHGPGKGGVITFKDGSQQEFELADPRWVEAAPLLSP